MNKPSRHTPITGQELAEMRQLQQDSVVDSIDDCISYGVEKCVNDVLPRCLSEIDRLTAELSTARRQAALDLVQALDLPAFEIRMPDAESEWIDLKAKALKTVDEMFPPHV